MNKIEPLVDIHCHMLPGLDDGATDWKESLAMARMAASDGIATVVATPHQLGNYGRNRGSTIRQLVEQFQERLTQQNIPLQVLPGADVRIEPGMIAKIRSREVVTLADRGRYILLELPHEIYLPLDRLLNDLDRFGLVGILSHPERNRGILRQPSVLEPLVQQGCLLQVTASSLVGTFGGQVQQLAESLITKGLVHFLATDAHGTRARRPLLGRGYGRVVKLAGHEAANMLCCRNPASVVANKRVQPGRWKPNPAGLSRWFSWRKAG